MSERRYEGGELELFALARNWKARLAREIRPWLGADVVEVGAGLGATTAALITPHQRSWTCLEPDPGLARTIEEAVASGSLPPIVRVHCGTLASARLEECCDTVLYVDVLEHVDDDAAETRIAARALRPGGRVVVLAPAHQWLFSPFDEAVGHRRRYSRRSLAAAVPGELGIERLRYLDSAGLLASAANRWLLRQSQPDSAQVQAWDRLLVPVSAILDPLTAGRLGKSVLGVFRRPGGDVAPAGAARPGKA